MHSDAMLQAIGHLPLAATPQDPICLMEICGTHTMSIAKAGLRRLLPPHIRLLSGPGCPVCVTPSPAIDALCQLALSGVCVVCYGDLLRVPGSRPDISLNACRAKGAKVKMVYSVMDALELAAQTPDTQFVFAGVGFETTAPGTAIAIQEAKRRSLKNFRVFCLLKYTLPAVHALLNGGTCRIDGLICPGHVATVIGADAFAFLPTQYQKPAVVSGFETPDVVNAVYSLCAMLANGKPTLINAYPSAVKPQGNAVAQQAIQQVFTPCPSEWRGLGLLPDSGMAIREEYADFDAQRFYTLPQSAPSLPSPCRCGDILSGTLFPSQCPLFGSTCTPQNPVGPCMVSGEGACAAAYKYGDLV